MAINKHLTWIIGLICFSNALAQEQTEIERKYVGENLFELENYILTTDYLGGFGLAQHSSFTYYDIYFDTPEKDLLNNGLSLRMRFQYKPGVKDSLGFMFQLKSEMEYSGAIRYEMEETELDFYLIDFQGTRTNIAALLQLFFNEMPAQKPTSQQIEILKTIHLWIEKKAGAPLAPFQGLRHLFPQIFSNDKIATLQAATFGQTTRQRLHIFMRYTEQDTLLSKLEKRQRPKADLPPFFRKNIDAFWLMEASFDQSLFHCILADGTLSQLQLEEFEVEKKYSKKDGATIMQLFENALLEKFDLKPDIRSKYKQLMHY